MRQRRFTRQELRLARALAGLAAVALHNAKAFGRLSRGDHEGRDLQTALSGGSPGCPRSRPRATADDALRGAAALAAGRCPP